LTAEVLKHNPGDYHAWQHRRKCIDALGIPLDQEIKYINSVGIALEKNFQIWHHRRCIMEKHAQGFDEEKDYLMMIMESDAKNYHAWSYRLWLIERFNLWKDEVEFVEFSLDYKDAGNNSLWSYRYFLKSKLEDFTKELVEREIAYAQKLLEKKGMTNEAAWVYLKGWLALSPEEAGNHQN
jgi:protein farnesyltransferase/geranylgeranyltransferase type-1 subunit alpha